MLRLAILALAIIVQGPVKQALAKLLGPAMPALAMPALIELNVKCEALIMRTIVICSDYRETSRLECAPGLGGEIIHKWVTS